MAELHNALTGYPKLLEAFRRVIGERSQAFSGIERAGETLTPVMDLWSLPEWALFRGEVLYQRRSDAPALAARYSSHELVNPTGSGVLAVVLGLRNIGAQMSLSVDAGASIAANPVTKRGVACDTRWPSVGEVSRCALVGGDVAATVSLIQDTIPATTGQSFTPYILSPGFKLFVIADAVNLACYTTFFWTERPLLAGEGGI